MKKTAQPSELRLRKRHGDGSGVTATAEDGEKLIRQQELRAAIVAGLIAITVFCIFWVLLTELFGSVFPWATLLLGYFVGHAVRLAGKGLDWRFPVAAAVIAVAGAIVANIVIAASAAGADTGAGVVSVLRDATATTWLYFFKVIWNADDTIYALGAAGIAAFFANRKLSREQYFALRRWRETRQ